MILEKLSWLISKTLPVHVSSMIYIFGLMLTILITRGIVIHHFLKHHAADMAREKIKDLADELREYRIQLDECRKENERLRVRLKTIRAAVEG